FSSGRNAQARDMTCEDVTWARLPEERIAAGRERRFEIGSRGERGNDDDRNLRHRARREAPPLPREIEPVAIREPAIENDDLGHPLLHRLGSLTRSRSLHDVEARVLQTRRVDVACVRIVFDDEHATRHYCAPSGVWRSRIAITSRISPSAAR